MKNAKLFWPTGQTTVFFQIYIILYFSCIGFNKWIRPDSKPADGGETQVATRKTCSLIY